MLIKTLNMTGTIKPLWHNDGGDRTSSKGGLEEGKFYPYTQPLDQKGGNQLFSAGADPLQEPNHFLNSHIPVCRVCRKGYI